MDRGVWFVCLWLLGSAVFAAEPPPVAAYGALPEFDNVEISPDGQRLLMLRPREESQHLTVLDIEAGSHRLILASNPAEFLFNWCHWANEERIVCSVRAYVQRTAGAGLPGYRPTLQKLTVTRLFAVNADGTNFLALVPPAVSRAGRELEWNSQLQDQVISWLPEQRDEILIQLDRDKPVQPSVFQLNIYTNHLTRVLKSRSGIRAWFADHRGEVRLAVGFRDAKPVALIKNRLHFAELDITPFITDLPPQPRSFSPDGSSLYLEMFQGGKRGIYEVRLSDLAVVRPVLVAEAVDVYGGLFVAPRTGELIGEMYKRDLPVVTWFDPAARAMDQRIATALPEPVRVPTSIDDARNRVVFVAATQTSPPTCYLFDDKAAKLTRIGSAYPKVPQEWIAP